MLVKEGVKATNLGVTVITAQHVYLPAFVYPSSEQTPRLPVTTYKVRLRANKDSSRVDYTIRDAKSTGPSLPQTISEIHVADEPFDLNLNVGPFPDGLVNIVIQLWSGRERGASTQLTFYHRRSPD